MEALSELGVLSESEAAGAAGELRVVAGGSVDLLDSVAEADGLSAFQSESTTLSGSFLSDASAGLLAEPASEVPLSAAALSEVEGDVVAGGALSDCDGGL